MVELNTFSLDASRIRWVETVGGTKVKARGAQVVRLDYGGGEPGELALSVRVVNGGACLIPIRAVARVDLEEG